MPYYCVNKNQTLNPGLHHEVHTHEHAYALKIRESIDLGWHASETDAVRYAKAYYSDGGCQEDEHQPGNGTDSPPQGWHHSEPQQSRQ